MATINVAPGNAFAVNSGSVTTPIFIGGFQTTWTTTAPVFTVAGVAGCSISGVSVISDIKVTASLTVGTAIGTLTVTETNTGVTYNVTILPATNWALQVDDKFTRGSYPTTGNAAGGTNVGAPDTFGSGAWIDKQGGVYAVTAANVLTATFDGIDKDQYLRDLLLRPAIEAAQDQMVVLDVPAGAAMARGIALAYQSGANTGYFFGVQNGGSTNMVFNRLTGTGQTQLGGGLSGFTPYDQTHPYQVVIQKVKINPTYFHMRIYDTNGISNPGVGAGTLVGACGISDSTSALQTSGQLALIFYSTSNAVNGTTAFTRFRSFVNVPFAPASSVNVGNANLFLSPYTWDTTTTGQAATGNAGSYLKTIANLSVTSDLYLNLNTSTFGGLIASDPPTISYIIDNGAEVRQKLTPAVLGGTAPNQYFKLASGLAAGAHTVYVVFTSHSQIGSDAYDPANALIVTGIGAGAGTLTLTAPTLLARRYLIYGDSITDGEGTETFPGAPNYGDSSNAEHSYAAVMASAFGAEYGQNGSGGLAWLGQGAANGLVNSWPYYFSNNHSRLVGGLFSPQPDYLFVNMGTNGAGLGTTGLVSTWLAAVRAAAGTNCKIVMITPFRGSGAAYLLTEFQTYQGGAGNVTTVTLEDMTAYKGIGDPNCYLLNLGSQVLTLTTTLQGTYDTVHPITQAHAQIASRVSRLTQAVSGTVTVVVGTYTAAGNVRSGTNRGDGVLGTLVVPPQNIVLAPNQYGAGGTEFTGSASGGGGPTADQIVTALFAKIVESGGAGLNFGQLMRGLAAYTMGNTDGSSAFRAANDPSTTRITANINGTTEARTNTLNLGS